MGLLLFTCFAEKLPQNNLYSNIFTTQNLKHDRVHCFVFPCGNVVSNELQSRHTISHIRTQQGHSVSSHVLCRRCDPARRRGVCSKRSRAQRRSLLFRRRSRRIRRRPRNVARFRPIEREAETFLSLSLSPSLSAQNGNITRLPPRRGVPPRRGLQRQQRPRRRQPEVEYLKRRAGGREGGRDRGRERGVHAV